MRAVSRGVRSLLTGLLVVSFVGLCCVLLVVSLVVSGISYDRR